jgi:NADH-quinone oxidoreductase subunit N
MIVGAVLSVTQTDVKRLLAYSSIAHAGFILVGVLAFSQAAIGGVMFYLVAYGFATVAAFGLIAMVRQGGSEASHLSQWAGLGRNHPVFAAAFSFLLLAFAGIPLTSGFTAKYAAFAPAVAAGPGGAVLVLIAVLASAITAFVYVRLIVLLYFTEPTGDDVVVLTPSIGPTIAITVGVTATVVLGIVPSFLLELASNASQFLL